MASKQRFQELLAKLKEWSADKGNEELEKHLNELEAAVNALIEPQSDEEDPGGNNPGLKPKIP